MSATSSLLPTLRQSLRRLRRERGFTATVLVTLALCIGANVAMFAVIDAVLLRALPYPQAERLVTVMNSYPGAGAERIGASLPNYYERREGVSAFESVSIRQDGSAVIGEAGSPQRVRRDRVSPEFFDTLGAKLIMGQRFSEDQMLYENAQVLIITYEFWQDYFNGDPDVLNREIIVDSLSNRVVGVLEPGFRFLDSQARFFIPTASSLEDREINRRHSNNFQMIARLAEGVSVEAAQAEMDAYNEALLENDPFAEIVRNAGFTTFVVDLRDEVVREFKPLLLILQAGALSLLLIGCVNLVNLLLIRAKGRSKESAVRQSLGAGKRHVIGETLSETVALALGGGALGLGVGYLGIRLLETLGARELPLGTLIVFDWRVGVVSLVGALVVGLVLAAPIVAMNVRRDLAPALQTESRSGTLSKAGQRARHGFIVVQIALAFALLAGAGMLGLSLRKALQNEAGFRTERILTASLNLPWKNYQEDEQKRQFLERLLGELRALPGISEAGFTSALPFSGNVSNNATVVEGVELKPGDSLRAHYVGFAMGEYWKALAIPLVEGRFLEDADLSSEQRICVVDKAFADRYWPGESALGRRLAMDVEINEENAVTVVGVVGTVKQNSLTEEVPQGSVFMPYSLRSDRFFYLVVRTAMSPEVMTNSIRQKVLSIDPELPLDDVRVMQQRIDDSLLARRSPAILAGIFAGVALLLASVGTYGVLAYAVGERTREIGVRVAIGASRVVVLRQFLLMGGRLLLFGLLLGCLAAWAAGLGMRSVLYEVDSFHVGIVAVAAGMMSVIVVCSTFLPSRRAASISPMEAMREA
ncbi:ADOP family duplicated permease [Pelagicoccus sp. SDUM812003]|uniref:ADOP family duplicated permease n=1 Tax=Pelagicoccus sp. SDUM812003 TaxID=3041267 RepID=UPI00280F306F|nr:ADOP family duplicated permease [Pelagicoccus sp. SDUM812003]MDQ8202361.1 ADOP family duplicated permease [Pelagicoccus sp. SDUM812003]